MEDDIADQQLSNDEIRILIQRLESSPGGEKTIRKESVNFSRDLDLRMMSSLFDRGRPLLAISILRFAVSNDCINKKLLHPCVKLYTMIKAFGLGLGESDKEIYQYLCHQTEITSNEYVSAGLKILLNACSVTNGNEWNYNALDVPMPEKNETFCLVAAIAILRQDMNALRILCDKMAPKLPLITSTKHPLFTQIIRAVTSKSRFADELMAIFMHQLIRMNESVKAENFDSVVKPILDEYDKWKTKPALVIDNGFCSNCKAKLDEKHELKLEEFIVLRKEFGKLVRELLQNFQGGSKKEFEILMRVINTAKNSLRHNSHPLVVDGLNLVGGSYENELMVSFYETILSLSKQNYSPIVIISKGFFPPNYYQKLKFLNTYFYTTSSRSQDDLFLISAALILGQNAYILTNDHLSDHARKLNSKANTYFNTWYKSRAINCIRDLNITRIPTYSSTTQKSKNGNYHLFREKHEVIEENGRQYVGLTGLKLFCVDTTIN